MMMKIYALAIACLLCLSDAVSAQTAVDQAVTKSGAKSTDSVPTKIARLLHLLNGSPYLIESSPNPEYKAYARFSATPESVAKQLIEKYSKDSSGAPFQPYELDSDRTPEEMLSQRIGGACGTRARVFAEMASRLGISKKDMRIVSAVCDDEYMAMCPNGKGSKVSKSYRGGASGHVFVLIRVNENWFLLNTTATAFDGTKGPHAKEILNTRDTLRAVKSKQENDVAQAKAVETMNRISLSDLEAAEFKSPNLIQEALASGRPVSVAEFQSLPETINGGIRFRKMTIFDVSEPDNYLQHKFKHRFNLIASGKKNDDTCRFTLPGQDQMGASPGDSSEKIEGAK